MSPTRIYFSVFLVFVGIAVQFASCEDDPKCQEIKDPGSDCTRLGTFEKQAKFLMDKFEATKKKLGIFGDIFGKDEKDESKSKCSSFGKVMEKFKNLGILKHLVIAPRTRWCGAGNVAKNDNDLGKSKETDACCREHDMCNDNIEAGDIKCNLKNNGLFTRSACLCDNKFYDCLKKVETLDSKAIGATYFNVLQPQCYTCVCPKNTTTDGSADGGCEKYKWKNSQHF